MGKLSLSRRSVLTGLVAVPLASVPANAAATRPSSSSELGRLIAEHEAASEALGRACELNDEISPQYDAYRGTSIWEQLRVAEVQARRRVLEFTPRSLADVATIGRHFAARITPINHCDFEGQWFGEALAQALARIEVSE